MTQQPNHLINEHYWRAPNLFVKYTYLRLEFQKRFNVTSYVPWGSADIPDPTLEEFVHKSSKNGRRGLF
jgi:hypothetical protein